MQKNDFEEDVRDLLNRVEERFSSEEKEEVKDVMIVALLEDNPKIDHPFNRRYYVYDSLNLLLQSDLGEMGRKIGMTFDMVFRELLERVNDFSEIDNEDLTCTDSAMYRISQISGCINKIRTDYESETNSFDQNFEESNANFTRHLEQ